MKKAECKHRVDKPKNILQWLDDAEERQRRGERQRKCPCCLLWIWESQYYREALEERNMRSEINRKTAHRIVQKIRKITHDVPLMTFEKMEEVIFSSLQIAEKRGEVVERRKTRTP